MDKRCPRKLSDFPDTYCPLAVQRLKAMRHAGRELSEEEESALPGCTWAVACQMANYCFFKFVEELTPSDGRSLSDIEIARYISISTDTVKKTEKKALQKLKTNEMFEEIADEYGDERILDDKYADVEFEINE
jgi:intein-encoded DNA endonuclease-like protein